MGRKSEYTIQQKVQAAKDFKNGMRGCTQICKDLGLHRSGKNLYQWIKSYETYGEVGFFPKKGIKIIRRNSKKRSLKSTCMERVHY